MQLLVGLGNPGAAYAGHRHNVGFMAIEEIARRHNAAGFSSRFHGRIAEMRLGGDKHQLLMPDTYMNRSGQAVGEALRYHKLEPAAVTVFHDELDLPLGKLKIKRGGGHGGHNGLRDIDAHIGKEYRRVRIGIGHPGVKEMVTGYVLHDFGKQERDAIDRLLDLLSADLPLLLEGREQDIMTRAAQLST